MNRLRFLTAGESHGRALTTIVEGMPAGVPLSAADINAQLARRQHGYGRGDRMKIERDQVEITSGVRHGLTLGSPISLRVDNRDWLNWSETMSPEGTAATDVVVTRVRPGHADLTGAVKYGHADVRNVLERASARETAMRVAAGAVARALLAPLAITVRSYTLRIGGIGDSGAPASESDWQAVEASPLSCLDREIERQMIAAIDAARQAGDTLGGAFRVVAGGVPLGLGSHVHWDRKLDGLLAQALMSLHSVKAVEFGAGVAAADLPGSRFHDQFAAESRPGYWPRLSNNAGGVEGGISNGEDLLITVTCKPIPTLGTPLPSRDLLTGERVTAHHERSDVCVIPAAGVVGEAMVALVLADAVLSRYGGDTLASILKACQSL